MCAAHSFTVDAAAKYFDWKECEYDDMPSLISLDEDDVDGTRARANTVCRLSGRTQIFIPTAGQMTDLILVGAANDLSAVEVRLGAFQTRSHANICGVRFTAGESLTGAVPSCTVLCV